MSVSDEVQQIFQFSGHVYQYKQDKHSGSAANLTSISNFGLVTIKFKEDLLIPTSFKNYKVTN